MHLISRFSDVNPISWVFWKNKQFGWVRRRSEKITLDSKWKGMHFLEI